LIAGIIFSLIPIITAAGRICDCLKTEHREFPIILVMAYGLLFTLLLFTLCRCTALTETSKTLRDQLRSTKCHYRILRYHHFLQVSDDFYKRTLALTKQRIGATLLHSPPAWIKHPEDR
jgi:hypothetical protein